MVAELYEEEIHGEESMKGVSTRMWCVWNEKMGEAYYEKSPK
jgi:hypothetical protein